MKKVGAVTFALLFMSLCYNGFAQKYKSMMYDYQYNFYDVVKEAEAYFATHEKGKGSGYKGYMRWKNENEGKFSPSGDRSAISPYFIENSWQSILQSAHVSSSRGNQNSWTDLGPYDVNNVTSHYSEGIGRIETFYVNKSNPNIIYLGSRSGGFWRTTDGGQNWLCSTDTMLATGVYTLSASQSHPDSVVIDIRNANNGYSQGVHTSTNGGLNWTLSSFNPTNLGWGGLGRTGKVNVVAIDPYDSKTVYIGTDRGLYKSTDFMNSYTRLVSSGNYIQIAFHPTIPNTIYAYDRNNPNRNVLRISTNGGVSFTNSSTISGNNNNTTVRLSTSDDCPNCVYFSSNNGVWKSTNGGMNFNFLSNPGSNGNGFAVSDVDTAKMIYGYVDLFASSDGGQSFTQRTWWSTGNSNHTGSSYIHADLRAAHCINGVFYVGTDGLLCKSADGGVSWDILNEGTGIREFYRFGLSQSKAHLSMAGSQDNGTSIHNSNGWIEWNGGDGMEAVVHTLNEDWMVGSWQYGNRNRTKNGGQTRQNVDHATTSDWIAPMVFDPNHQMRIYSFGSSIYRSDTYGGNWSVLAATSFGNIKHATIAENNSNIMLIVRNRELFASYDGGQTLVDLSNQLPNTRNISDIAIHPRKDSTVIITYDSYQDDNRRIYISHDLCQTWTNISYNLSIMPLRTVVMGFTDSNFIYVGGERGVYYKSMNATTWNLYSVDLPSVSVRELDIQWATNTLRAVTWGRGLWETKLVDRENFPEITTIDMSEKPTDTQPVEDLPIHVSAEVSYAGRLKEVYLMWSKDSAELNNKITMSLSGPRQYTTDTPIPAFPKGTEMYFKVFAVSVIDEVTESYKFNYSYRECFSRPSVTANASQTNVCRGDSITLFGSGASTYEWDNGVVDNQAFQVDSSLRYSLIGRDNNGCADQDYVDITVDTADITVNQVGRVLEATASAAQFQWLDCNDNMNPLAGETNSTFTNQAGGSFAVVVTQNGCMDTSGCFELQPSGLIEFSVDGLAVYPNPVSDQFVVEFKQVMLDVQLELYDVTGKLVLTQTASDTQRISVSVDQLDAGTYTLKVNSELGQKSISLIKK